MGRWRTYSIMLSLIFLGTTNKSLTKILVLDFKSPIAPYISKILTNNDIENEFHPFTLSPEEIIALDPTGIILSGSPHPVYRNRAPAPPPVVYELGVPILGICYGHQLMCTHFGGTVEKAQKKEYGLIAMTIIKNSPLFQNIWSIGQTVDVWMGHKDEVTLLPPGFEMIASTKDCPYAIVAHKEKPFYGIQFHPESPHMPDGTALIVSFARNIVHMKKKY